MNERVKKLAHEIRQLSAEEQEQLLDDLLLLTNAAFDPEVEKAWAEEAERRLDGYLQGGTVGNDAKEVLAKYLRR
jgi:hypothetical protein